jgi:5-methyltetrahydropteroyltriglutamate--homocysteine methyltransferase
VKCDKILKEDVLTIEVINPRHKHEWTVFEQVHLPPGKVLVPSLIDMCSTSIEHPEVVVQRLVRFVRVVGR